MYEKTEDMIHYIEKSWKISTLQNCQRTE